MDFLEDWLAKIIGLKMVAFKIKGGMEEYKKIRKGYFLLADNALAKHSSPPASNYFLARWMPWWRIVRSRKYQVFLLLERDQINYFQVLTKE